MAQELTANDIENITKVIFPSWQKACKNFLSIEMCILNFAKTYYEKVQKIPIDENFNIFTAIAEKYRYENLHSDLLKVILGNEKNNINKKEIFDEFLTYIDISKDDQKKYFQNYAVINFHREYPKGKKDAKDIKKYGFIDLLIYTKEACIIIENKINGAPDRPEQLRRYNEMMETEKKEVIKTVYMPIDSNHPEPSNSVSNSEFNYIHIPYVTEENNYNKSFTKFLEQIISKKDSIKLNDTEKVFIEQYKLLLKSIGGQVLMEQYKKDFIKDIMTDKKYIQTADYFANNFEDIWNKKDSLSPGDQKKQLVDEINRNEGYPDMADYLAKNFKAIWELRTTIIGELLVDDIEDIAPDMKMVTDDICQKEIYPNVNIYYTYEKPYGKGRRDGNDIEFGFRPAGDEGFDEDTANKLKETFTSLSKSIFKFCPKKGDISGNKEWVYLHVYDLSSFMYKEIKAELKECLRTLEKEAKNVLSPQKKKTSALRRPSQSIK